MKSTGHRILLSVVSVTLIVGFFGASAFAQTNAVPFLNQPLVPSAAAPGGPAFTLTVNGAGFVPSSVVNWNGSPRATTFVSGLQLTAHILASDIARAGTATVSVSSAAPGGGVSNPLFFPVIVPGNAITTTRSDFTVGIGADGLIARDFNGDGKLDLAVRTTNCDPISCLPGTLSIFLGQGNGTFQHLADYGVGTGAGRIAAGDFNGDGKLDLAVTNDLDNTVSVLLGNGDGTFANQTTFATGIFPFQLVAADMNGDGKLDLVVGLEGPVLPGSFSLLLGNGDGTFQPAKAVSLGSGTGASLGITVGDFNRDGKLDVAVTDSVSNPGQLVILTGNGDGTFGTPLIITPGFEAPTLTTADFNGDGKLDLAVAGFAVNGSVVSGTVAIMLGNGDGTFQSPVSYPTGPGPAEIIAEDFTGNGKLDLVISNNVNATNNTPSGAISFLLGNGDGTFQPHIDVATATGPWSMSAGDFNGDGAIDLAVSGSSTNCVSVLLQSLQATVSLSPASLTFTGTQRVGTVSTPQDVTLTNNGRLSVQLKSISVGSDFKQTNKCPKTLGLGKSCTIAVEFAPRVAGTLTETLTVTDTAAGSPQTLSLTGTAVALQTSPTQVNFGGVKVGTKSKAALVTVTNVGVTGSVTISSISISGTNMFDFAQSNACKTLAPGASCSIVVSFAPSIVGNEAATIEIFTAGTNNIVFVSLTGTGT